MKQARNELSAIFVLAAVWAAMAAIIGLGGDYPLNDDWAYAQSARLFLHTGQMRILDWAAPSLVVHIASGAAFMRLLGESHVALRMGTRCFALVTLFFTYGLSRRAGLSARRALLPPLALAVSPWFVNLSFTFMSDVTWLAFVIAALWLGASALRPNAPPRLSRLLLASVCLGLAAMIRQFAVVLLPAFVLVVAIDARRRVRGFSAVRADFLRSAIFTTLPVVVIYGAFHYWYTRIHGPTLANRDTWRNMANVDLLTIVRHVLSINYYIGLWLLPLVLATRVKIAGTRARRVAMVTAIAMALFALGEAIRAAFSEPRVWGPSSTIKPLMPYLGNIFYLSGIGPPTLYPTYSGYFAAPHTGVWFGVMLTLISLLGGVLASALILRAIEEQIALLRGKPNPNTEAPVANSEEALFREVRMLIGVAGVFYLGWHLCTGPFLFDRYVLPVLPLSWILGVAMAGDALRRWPFIVLFSAGALISAAGTHEYLQWNAARAQAVSDLIASGIPTAQIDAGFEYNGPWRFEEYLRSGGTLHHPDSSWWSPRMPYRLAFEPHRGCETVGRYPFWTWPGGGQPAIHVLHCSDSAPAFSAEELKHEAK